MKVLAVQGCLRRRTSAGIPISVSYNLNELLGEEMSMKEKWQKNWKYQDYCLSLHHHCYLNYETD
jgi:hypothetical protein